MGRLMAGRNCAVIRYLAYFSQPGLFKLPQSAAYGRIQRIASRVIGAIIRMFALGLLCRRRDAPANVAR